MGRDVRIPDHVRASLADVFRGAVEDVRVIEHSWFAWLHARALATTRPGCIYLRGSADEFFENPEMVLHEFYHVLGQWQPRALTVGRYVREWLRKGYWDNRFEVEAREFATDHHYRFRARLAHHRAAASPHSAEQGLALVQPARREGQGDPEQQAGGDRQQHV